MSDHHYDNFPPYMSSADAIDIIGRVLLTSDDRGLSDLEVVIIEQCLENQTYQDISDKSSWSVGHIRNVAQSLWQRLEENFNEPVNKKTLRSVLARYIKPSASRHRSCSNAPEVIKFFGRATELATLREWIVADACHFVGVFGLGGIGKTHLAAKLVEDIQDEFDYVIWRSLINAPPPSEMLSTLIKFLSHQQDQSSFNSINDHISVLLEYLQQKRCLLIFDNFESVLQSRTQPMGYLQGYEQYGHLIQQIGETSHQSCLLMTSREKPAEVALLEGKTRPVRAFSLAGLDDLDSRSIFDEISSFTGLENDWHRLNTFYEGNPLALELVAKHIQEVFHGNISEFLESGRSIFSDIGNVLDWHCMRLSEQEIEVMIWLAISRTPLSLNQIKENLLSLSSKESIGDTLQSLRRRLPIEVRQSAFTLQPVLIEYFKEKFIKQAIEEIRSNNIQALNTHAIVQTASKDYVKESQNRVVLQPILELALDIFYDRSDVEHQLSQLLLHLRSSSELKKGYAPGNILNLLCGLRQPLRSHDFSGLTIRQADLQGKELIDINFSQSCFDKSTFTQGFSGIYGLAFSPNGEQLAAAGTDGAIILMRVKDSQKLLVMKHEKSKYLWIPALDFHPDGHLLASGGFDHQVKLWDLQTGQCLRTFEGHTQWIWGVGFSTDGQLLASAANDNTVRIWQVATGECIRILEDHTSWVQSVDFSPDGRYLATASYDRTIRLWDVETWNCEKVFEGHQAIIGHVSFSSDSLSMVSVSADTTVRLWNVQTGQCDKILRGHSAAVRSGTFSSDSQTVVSGDLDGNLRIWDIQSGECLHNIQGHSDWVRAVAASPDPSIVASADFDQTIKLWNVKTGQCLRTIKGHCTWAYAVAFHPNGETLVSGHLDKVVRLWSLETSECSQSFYGHSGWIHAVAYHPNGEIIASGSYDQTVRIWDAKTGTCLRVLDAHFLGVRSLAFSPDGQVLASAGDDTMIRLWNVKTWDCLLTLEGHTQWIPTISFSGDGQTLASCSEDQSIKLWDTKTGQCLQTIPLDKTVGRISSLIFSADGQTIISGDSSRPIRFWDAVTQNSSKSIKEHGNHTYTSLASSPDDAILATSGDSTVIKLWDTSTGELISEFNEHSDCIPSLAFSPDASRLASASLDATIKIWDVESGVCIQTLQSPNPYERINIAGIKGISEAQKATLLALGARDSN